MRKLIGRAGPLLVFAPARLQVMGSRDPRQDGPEDLWDPAGVPGPLEIVLPSSVRRWQWWLRAAGRR